MGHVLLVLWLQVSVFFLLRSSAPLGKKRNNYLFDILIAKTRAGYHRWLFELIGIRFTVQIQSSIHSFSNFQVATLILLKYSSDFQITCFQLYKEALLLPFTPLIQFRFSTILWWNIKNIKKSTLSSYITVLFIFLLNKLTNTLHQSTQHSLTNYSHWERLV